MNMKPNQKPTSTSSAFTRRDFIRKAVKGATVTALFAGLPKGWVGSVYASDAPETTKLRCGIIALTDNSPFVVGAEKGFFKKYGERFEDSEGKQIFLEFANEEREHLERLARRVAGAVFGRTGRAAQLDDAVGGAAELLAVR